MPAGDSDNAKLGIDLNVFGVEFVEGAEKSLEELKDQAKGIQSPISDATEVLVKTSNVVEDLKDKIEKLKDKYKLLTDETLAGILPLDKYKQQSDVLIETIRTNEVVLNRLTESEREEARALAEEIKAQEQADNARVKAISFIEQQAEALSRSKQEMETSAPIFTRTSSEIAGKGDGESGEGGFAGIAGKTLKAEKAISSLVSGHALGRLGPMLESVLGPLGVPGLGLALGAIAFEAEPAIRAVKDFVDAWDKGIKPINDAVEAIERLGRAQGEERQKRAARRIQSQITALEDKEDVEGVLTAKDAMTLQRLRESLAPIQDREMQEQARAEYRKRQETAKKENLEIDEFTNKMFERTKQERAEAEDLFEKRGVKNAQQKQKDFEKTMEENEREINRLDLESQHAQRQKEQAQKRLNQGALREQRLSTPEAQRRARELAERNAIDVELEAESRQSGGATPEFMEAARGGAMTAARMGAPAHRAASMGIEAAQHGPMSRTAEQVALEALERLPDTGGNGALAIRQAIMAAFQRGQQLNQRELARLQQWSISYQE